MSKTFKVNMYVQEWHTIEVEANSIDEAKDKAYEHGLDGDPHMIDTIYVKSETTDWQGFVKIR